MSDDLIKIKLDGNFYIIPKHVVDENFLSRFPWEYL